MKKLLTILISSLFILHSAPADELDDMLETVAVAEHVKDVRDGLAVKAEVENYVGQRLWYIGEKFGWTNASTAFQNTYYWYLWRDFNRASGFEKLELGEILKDKPQKPARTTHSVKD